MFLELDRSRDKTKSLICFQCPIVCEIDRSCERPKPVRLQSAASTTFAIPVIIQSRTSHFGTLQMRDQSVLYLALPVTLFLAPDTYS